MLNQLRKEYFYHKFGGTDYRKETARLALNIAKKTYDPSLFLNERETVKIVNQLIPYGDQERKKDVSKMLLVMANHITRQRMTPTEKRYVDNILKKRLFWYNIHKTTANNALV